MLELDIDSITAVLAPLLPSDVVAVVRSYLAYVAATRHDGTLDAAKLNELVKAAMQDADNLPQLVRCDLYSDYNFPDTTRKRPRYQAVFGVVHY